MQEAADAQKASEEMGERLNDFLNDNQSKSSMAQLAEVQEAAKQVTPVVKPEQSAPLVDVKPVNRNTSNNSGKNNNPAVEEKKSIKISFSLDAASDSGEKNDNITNKTSLKFVGNTQAGSSVSIQMGDVVIATPTLDDKGNFDFNSIGTLGSVLKLS